jgi:hypothetical protein
MTKFNNYKSFSTLTEGKEFSSKALVLYGSNLGSTVGFHKFTAIERKAFYISVNLLSVFIGIILSDANISKSNKGEARLQFKQTIKHIDYFYFIFFKLSHYCSKGPYITKTTINKKKHIGLGFTTRSLPCITELYNIFYVNNKKITPYELVNLMT